jgi:hypothetical protein
VLINTLAPCSLEACKTYNIAKWEAAEQNQDTTYIVSALIHSHAATATAGMSSFEVDTLIDSQALAYLQCTKGSDSMDTYLAKFQAHEKALCSQDSSIIKGFT